MAKIDAILSGLGEESVARVLIWLNHKHDAFPVTMPWKHQHDTQEDA